MTYSSPTIAASVVEERRGRRDCRRASILSNDGLLGELGGVQVEADRVQHEGRESGLVLVVEADALDAPAPPLHVLDVGHACAPSCGIRRAKDTVCVGVAQTHDLGADAGREVAGALALRLA